MLGEQVAHELRGVAVGVGHEGGVHVEGGGGVGVAESAGDGADIDAGGEQPGGDMVAYVFLPVTGSRPT